MSALLKLGPHIFEIIGLNYQSLDRETTANWASISRFGGHPARQFTGFGPHTTTINGLLFPDELGGRAAYEAIRATQGLGIPISMIGWATFGVGSFFGMVVIESVSDSQEYIAAHGAGRKLEFSVEVSSYG